MMPFPGGLESLANGTLILSVGAALLTIIMIQTGPTWRRNVLAGAAVALLALLVIVAGGPPLLAAALIFAASGNALIFSDEQGPVAGGMALLLIAYALIALLFVYVGTTPAVLAAAVLVVAGDVLRSASGLGRLRLPPMPAMLAGWIAHYAGLLLVALSVLL